MKYSRITEEELCSLKTILVQSNERVIGIQIARGYMGSGGTNHSDFSTESTTTYTAEELNGKEPIPVNKSEICALVNDVLYFRCKNNGELHTFTLDRETSEQLYSGDTIAYDTVCATKVMLLLKDR